MTPASPRVTLATSSIWRMRLGRELPRYLIGLMALAGLAASARFALAPPGSAAPRSPRSPAPSDGGAEAYAALFARRYLSWNAAEPQANERSLQQFLGSGPQAGDAVQLPTTGSQSVAWAEVVQGREPQIGLHVYTVAVQTDASGLVYLTVPVTRTPTGALALWGGPAFVGPPASAAAQAPGGLRAVQDAALEVVVRRALTNYLADQPGELAADLTSAARVSPPTMQLTLHEMGRLAWAPGTGTVLAQVQASDALGAGYTMAYEVDVARAQGRWEISAVQMDPYSR